MKGSDIAASLPKNLSATREQMILDHIRDGHTVLHWRPIVVNHGPLRATIFVTAQPLQLGEPGDSFRPSLSATSMQKAADMLGATLLTPKLVDEIWKQADWKVDPPVTMGSDVPMGTTQRMLDHSAAIDKRIYNKIGNYDPAAMLFANIGKYWVNSRHTSDNGPLVESNKVRGPGPAATNYGWFVTGKDGSRTVTAIPGVGLYQTPGHAHNYGYADYSQLLMFAHRSVEVCGPLSLSGLDGYWRCKESAPCLQADGTPGLVKCLDIYEIANDPKMAKIVSHEGTINMRYPGVPYTDPGNCYLIATSGLGSFGASACGPPPPPGPTGRGAEFVGASLVQGAAFVGLGAALGYLGYTAWERI